MKIKMIMTKIEMTMAQINVLNKKDAYELYSSG
jgi:hypothetical protein